MSIIDEVLKEALHEDNSGAGFTLLVREVTGREVEVNYHADGGLYVWPMRFDGYQQENPGERIYFNPDNIVSVIIIW